GAGLPPGREAEMMTNETHNPSAALSMARAWLALVLLSLRRQAKARQMVWIALGLLAFAAAATGVNNLGGRWGMAHFTWPRRRPAPVVRWRYGEWIELTQGMASLPGDPGAQGIQHAVLGSCRVILARKVETEDHRTISVAGFEVFSQLMIFTIYLSFLLPFCS